MYKQYMPCILQRLNGKRTAPFGERTSRLKMFGFDRVDLSRAGIGAELLWGNIGGTAIGWGLGLELDCNIGAGVGVCVGFAVV